MYRELLIRTWMLSRRSALMIIGTLMALETCLILGQVSHNLFYWKKTPPDGYMWSGWRLTRKELISRPDDHGQSSGNQWESTPSWRRRKSGLMKSFIVKCTKNSVRIRNPNNFWKLMNPQECVWEIRYRIITKTILQEKVKIHYSTTTWFTNLFLCLKLWKFLQRQHWWTRNGKN